MDDEICEIRRIIRQTGAHTYLVEWEGYPISEATEITTKDLTQFGAADMLQAFKRKGTNQSAVQNLPVSDIWLINPHNCASC